MSFYSNQINPNTKNKCLYLFCRDFLGLPISKDDLMKISINNDEIEMFLHLCFVVGYEQTLDIISTNIPLDNDFLTYDQNLYLL